MASTKTTVKKAPRRRGTVSLTKVRKAVNTVYARYTSSSAVLVKAKPGSVGKTN
ncbi:MAG TPA: hypothetical protein VG052_03190 [Puia sp.]|nr:hypothetical protein [Puia sp.]